MWYCPEGGRANIPAPPVGWYDFVRELLRIRDLQLRVRGKVSHQTAAELGLAPSFRDAIESGRLSFVAMKRQLAAEMQALHQVLLCVLISWLLCVLGGLCLTVLTVWHVNGLANSILGTAIASGAVGAVTAGTGKHC